MFLWEAFWFSYLHYHEMQSRGSGVIRALAGRLSIISVFCKSSISILDSNSTSKFIIIDSVYIIKTHHSTSLSQTISPLILRYFVISPFSYIANSSFSHLGLFTPSILTSGQGLLCNFLSFSIISRSPLVFI